jgi:putative YphP/YqiW family bacilliredoxin
MIMERRISVHPLYNPEVVKPMWQELEEIGVKPLTTAQAVDEAMAVKKGTVMVVVNSVCGCAAGHARPGVALALQNKAIPDRLYTVFAGVDREATARAREYMVGMPASSPSVALFKDGELVFMLHRRQIELIDMDNVARHLTGAFDLHCQAPGPSVALDVMAKAFNMSINEG